MCGIFMFAVLPVPHRVLLSSFFFNDTATTEIYTLSLHDALPIWTNTVTVTNMTWTGGILYGAGTLVVPAAGSLAIGGIADKYLDRKSTRLNSSHLVISYAGFCLKKKKCTV